MRYLYLNFLLCAIFIFSFPYQAKGINPVNENSITMSGNLSISGMNRLQKNGDDFFVYKRRAKTLNIAGGVSLGLGVGTLLFWGVLHGAMDTKLSDPIDAGLLATSIGLCGASVPLFIYAAKNRKKALSIGAGSQTVCISALNGTIQQQQPAISICLNF